MTKTQALVREFYKDSRGTIMEIAIYGGKRTSAICAISPNEGITEGEALANAWRLHAAPELEEALKDVLQFVDFGGWNGPGNVDRRKAVVVQARAALAKQGTPPTPEHRHDWVLMSMDAQNVPAHRWCIECHAIREREDVEDG